MSFQDPTPSVSWALLARYVAGECTPEERVEIEAWLIDDPVRARLIDELNEIWSQAGRSFRRRSITEAWSDLQERLNLESQSSAIQVNKRGCTQRQDRKPVAPRHTMLRYVSQLLVVIFVASLSAYFVIHFGGEPVRELNDLPLAERVFKTQRGERATITLKDGTRVRLNVSSTLAVPETFGSETRQVRLDGEAFFEVAKDTLHPFVILTEHATMNVLGTSFSVRTLNEGVKVFVTEGQVALSTEGSIDASELETLPEGPAESLEFVRLPAVLPDTVVLRANQLGVVSNRRVQAIRHGINPDNFIAWTEGKLIFDQAPFDQVIAELERWYDLDVETVLSHQEVVPLTSTFSDESLSEILRTIAATLDLRFERHNRTVYFYPREH